MTNDHEVLVPERQSALAALCMLPIYYLALPSALTQFGLDAHTVNYLFFTIGFALVCLLFFPFLWRSAPMLVSEKERVMHGLAAGAIGHYAGAFLLALALVRSGVVPQTQNNQTLQEMSRSAPVLTFLFSVLAVPVTEECLFRGALFGTLRKRSRVAAYLVTAFAFAAIHAIPGVAAGRWQDVYAVLPYLAPGLALCYAYEYSGTIWTSIILHALINAVSFVFTLVHELSTFNFQFSI